MKRFIVIVSALSMLFAGCVESLEEIDEEQIADALEIFQDIAEDGELDLTDANTNSADRPPVFDGGELVTSQYQAGEGSSELWYYEADEASFDDLTEYYDDFFGPEATRETGTMNATRAVTWATASAVVTIEEDSSLRGTVVEVIYVGTAGS